MIDIATGAALSDGLIGVSAAMQGQSLTDAYNQRITGQYETNLGPTIGYADYTSNTPAISGHTDGSISTGSGDTASEAWEDYVEDEPNVSDVTGGAVSGSNVWTFAYSLMEEHPGTATAAVKAVMPVAVPVRAAIVAMGQALGVSIDYANLEGDIKSALVDSYTSTAGVIYDEARELVTAWKDEWGRILFPKEALDTVYEITKEWGGEEHIDYDDVPRDELFNPNANFVINPFSPSFTYTYMSGIPSSPTTDTMTVEGSGTVYAYIESLDRTSYYCVSDQPFTVTRSRYPYTWESIPATKNNITYYWAHPSTNQDFSNMIDPSPTPTLSEITGVTDFRDGHVPWDVAYLLFHGTAIPGGYPEGASESSATSYTPSTIPVAGNLATSYDPDTGTLITEPLVPIHLTDDPYDATGDTVNPTDPTDDANPGVLNPPIPFPIPDTKPSNPDVPLVNPSIVDSTLVDELVEELANTLDPQPPQSSGVIPVPQLPGILDPDTGHITFPSIIPSSGTGFIHVYNPTPAEFVAFGSWLWVSYADATIDKILNNPFDGVIGAHELYATPNRGGRDNIRSAFLVCPTTADLVPDRYSEIDCGTVIVPEFYGNYLDYSPYSQAYIYLPFIGIVEVSIDDIVGHAVNIRYRVDSYSGSCIAMIFVAKNGYQNLCYQFAGSCSVEVPMAGGSQAAIKAGMMQAEAYANAGVQSAGLTGIAQALGGLAGGLAHGGLAGALGGLASGAISGLANYGAAKIQAGATREAARVANKSSVQHSGTFGASHGAMGVKIPFIIIRNPIQVKVVNYNDDYGFPAHKRVIIGGCTGYLRVKEVNVISPHATNEEKIAIEEALKAGVYVT